MFTHIKKYFIETADRMSYPLLDNPYMFNYVRYLLAGEQKKMKQFIKINLEKYNCKTVADICSGTGDFASLVSKDTSYVGLDLNKEFINFAKKRYKGEKNKKFLKANILKSNKTTSEKYDAVMLISTIHHFSDEELDKLLPVVKLMTKKVLLVADIIPDPPHFIQRFFASIDRGKYVRTEKDKVKILKKYFKVVRRQAIPTRSAVQLGIVCEPK